MSFCLFGELIPLSCRFVSTHIAAIVLYNLASILFSHPEKKNSSNPFCVFTHTYIYIFFLVSSAAPLMQLMEKKKEDGGINSKKRKKEKTFKSLKTISQACNSSGNVNGDVRVSFSSYSPFAFSFFLSLFLSIYLFFIELGVFPCPCPSSSSSSCVFAFKSWRRFGREIFL